MRRFRYSPVLLLGLVALASGCSYNKLQRLDEQINAAQSQIKVQLQRRNDLIPNLVATVKGITKQEDTVFISIANARARIGARLADQRHARRWAQANAAMAAPLEPPARAFRRTIRPCKAARTSRRCRTRSRERRTGWRRREPTTTRRCRQFNSTIRQFPTNITAKMFGLGKPRPYFDLTTPGAANVPTVKF